MFLRLWPSDKLLYIPIEDHHIAAINAKHQLLKSTLSNKATMLQLSRKSLAGPGYIILNAIRVMNIVSFLAVIAASIVMLVKTNTSTDLFFFDALSHVITAITSMFLIASELSLFPNYFATKWPLLSPAHGFLTLGCTMLALGIDVIGNLNKPDDDQQALGLPFWRIVIASGIIIFILGFINVIASFIFSDRDHGITARQVRADGAVALSKTPVTGGYSTPPAPVLAQSYLSSSASSSPTKEGNAFKIVTQVRRDSLLPSYNAAQPDNLPAREPTTPSSRYSRATDCNKKKMWTNFLRNGKRDSLAPPLPISVRRSVEISGPMGVNPQFAHLVQRPDSALHPSRTGDSNPYRWKP